MLEIHANYTIKNAAAAGKCRCEDKMLGEMCQIKKKSELIYPTFPTSDIIVLLLCCRRDEVEHWIQFLVVVLCIRVTSEVSPRLSHLHCCVIVIHCGTVVLLPLSANTVSVRMNFSTLYHCLSVVVHIPYFSRKL